MYLQGAWLVILEALGEQLIKSSLTGRIPEGLSHAEA